MRFVILFLVVLSLAAGWSPLAAQVNGRVFDAKTGAPMAFVNVVMDGNRAGTMSDIDGRFSVQEASAGSRLIFSFVGYNRFTYTVPSHASERSGVRIEMTAQPVELAEAVVLPGENPAEALMRKVIASKDTNNPENCCPFTYDSYNKLVFTALIDSSLVGNPERIAALDTSDQEAVRFFEEQHILLMESISERRFIPPGHSTEEVKASRFSGLSDPDFVLLGTQLQSFSFYTDEISLLDYRYLSPLHDASIRKYLFVIEDTTYHAADTVFILSFQPRSGKNFNGMKGLLYINSNGYALESVLAEPAASNQGGFDIRIRQRYSYIDNRQWFPVQLNTDIVFNNIQMGPFAMVGVGRSYLKNIRLDAPLKRRDVGTIALRIDPIATRQPESYWQEQRFDSLDARELRTYTFMDSVSKELNFDRRYKALQALASGRIGIGYFDIDLNRLLRYTDYEGIRTGLGLYTNDRVIKNVSIGGYAAYGFGDRAFKWGTDATWKIHPRSGTSIKAAFYDDIFETGGQRFPDEGSLLGNKSYYLFFVNRMDRLNAAELGFTTRLPFYLTLSAGYRQGILQYTGLYDYVARASDAQTEVTALVNQMDIREAEVSLRWSHREVLYQTNRRLLQAGIKNPVVGLTLLAGEVDPAGTTERYYRVGASVEHTFKMTQLGNFSVFAHGGRLFGNAPAMRYFNFRASREMFTIATPFAFETIEPGQFMATEYAALHLRHSFKDLLFKSEKFRPHFVLVHSMGIGRFDQRANHRNLNVTAPELGHVESGLEIQNLLRSGFTGLGIGGYYRYGAANVGIFEEDFVAKLVLSLAF